MLKLVAIKEVLLSHVSLPGAKTGRSVLLHGSHTATTRVALRAAQLCLAITAWIPCHVMVTGCSHFACGIVFWPRELALASMRQPTDLLTSKPINPGSH